MELTGFSADVWEDLSLCESGLVRSIGFESFESMVQYVKKPELRGKRRAFIKAVLLTT